MFSTRPGHRDRWNLWNTRISKALSYALIVPLISFVASVSTPEIAKAAVTVGTGICAQSVNSATGVTVTQVGNDCVITFSAPSNTTTNNSWTVPTAVTSINVLVVGGGGSGGSRHAGGGGAGGYIYQSGVAVTPSASKTISVGSGGAAVVTPSTGTQGNNGTNSVFDNLTAYAGGSGGQTSAGGGGSSIASTGGSCCSTTATTTSNPLQGNSGGQGTQGDHEWNWSGGGGGGAGGNGGNSTSDANNVVIGGNRVTTGYVTAGSGGAGVLNAITGTATCYAGGGGGAVASSGTAAGAGGQCTDGSTSGGAGSKGYSSAATQGVDGTGGGGGGAGFADVSNGTSGRGGSGIIIVRYTALQTITFNTNNSTFGSPSAAALTQTTVGGAITLATVGTMARTGFTFAGWNTSADGMGSKYAAGSSLTPTSSLTLYAQWNASISYDSNTATSTRTIESTTALSSSPVTALSNGKLVRGTPISDGLVFNMNAADSSSIVGSTWYDASRNGVTGTLFGSPTYNPTDGYLQFNGTSQYVSMGNTLLTGGNTDMFTASVMFKADQPNASDTAIFSHYYYNGSTDGTWIIRQLNNSYSTWRTTNGDLYGTNPVMFNEGSINYATITYDGTKLSLYLNGVLQNSAVWGSAGTATADLRIAARGYLTTITNYWAGKIYSVQGYSRALTAAEVLQNYQAMIPGQVATKANFTLTGWNTAANGSGTPYGTANTDLAALPKPYLRLLPSGYSVVGSTATWTPVNGSGAAFTYTATPPTYNASSGGAFGATNRFPTISGGTANGIALNNPQINTFTMCAVARYKNVGTGTGTQGRIIGSSVDNWITGWYAATMNEFHHGSFNYNSATPADMNWHYVCHTGNRGYWDGTKVPWSLNSYTYLAPITINKDVNGQTSDFELAELIIYDQFLSDSQIDQVNRYLKNTYGITSGTTTGLGAVNMAPPSNYAAAGDTTLYAQWGSEITYDGNNQSSGAAPSPTLISSSNSLLATNSGSLTRPGWRFDGWNTAADGSGTNYAAGSVYPNTGNITLYAKWTIVTAFPSTLTVKDPNLLSPYMRYRASDFDATNKIWKDSSGNSRNVGLITGTPSVVTTSANTNGSTKSFQVVQGSNTDVINFNNPQSSANSWTLFNVARYNGGTSARILQSNDGAALYGFWASKSGMAYHNTWLTQYTTSTFGNNWVLSTDYSQHYRGNGTDLTVTAGGDTALRTMGINVYANEHSDFQVAEVIYYNRQLSISEIAQVEDYLAATYGISNYTPASNYLSSLSYAFATTVGGRTDTLTAANGLGNKSFSISPPVSGISLDTGTSNGVAVVVSPLVPIGVYLETLTATDQSGATATFNVQLTVVNAVKWTSTNATSLTTTFGKSAALRLNVSDGTTGKIATLTKPTSVSLSGITIDTTTLTGSGYVTLNVSSAVLPGTYTLVLTVNDDAKRSATQNVTLIVNSLPSISYPNGVSDTTTTVTKNGLWLQFEFPSSYSGTGTLVTDLTGNNAASGIISGTPYSSSLGGGSISLDESHYIRANIGTIQNTDSLSKFLWIYPTSSTGNIVYVCDSGCSYREAELALNNGQLSARVWNQSIVTTADTITINAWHYVGYIYDAAGTISIYIDGKLSATAASTGTRVAPTTTEYDGFSYSSSVTGIPPVTNGLSMSLGAAHYYKRVLSAAEVFNNFAATAPKYLSTPPPGLVVSGAASIVTTQGVSSSYPLFTATSGTGNKVLVVAPITAGITLDTSTLNTATLKIANSVNATSSTVAAVFTETITATDSVSAITNYKLSITVNPPIAIAATTATTLSTTAGIAVYDTFTATYGTPSYSYSVTSPTYPSAFTLTNPTNAVGVLSVANNLPAGTYYETITVTDSVGATINYPLTVIVNAALTLAGSPSNSISTTIGKSVSCRINVLNGTGTKTLTFTSPIAGITLDTSTVGSGYATLNVSTTVPANTFTATVYGVDGVGSSTSAVFTITVNKWLVIGSPSIVTSGLAVNLDASTYSGSGAWLDSSGNGKNATLGGISPVKTSPTFTSNSGGVFSFNEASAAGNYAQLANPGSLDTFTVSVWAKLSGTQANTALLTENFVSSENINFALATNGTAITGAYFTYPNWSASTTAFTPTANIWYNYTYSVYRSPGGLCNGSAYTYCQDLYVNGVRQSPSVGSNLAPASSSNNVNIGARWDANSSQISGQIGNVLIYKRALSDTEVIQNFNATGYRYLATNSGTASYTTTEGVVSAISGVTVSNGTAPNTITLSPTVAGVTIDTSVTNAFTLNFNGVTATNATTAKTMLETVTATDSATASTTLAYTITVNPPVQETYTAASITTTSSIAAYDTFTATFGTGTKTFTLSGSPSTAGFSLSSTTANQAVLTVLPTANPGTYYETVTATDAVGATKSMMVTIVLTPPPTILGSNTLTSTKGYAFRSPTYSVVNGIAPFTYALTSTAVSRPGNATTGITFDTPTMTLRVSTAVDTGTYSETITVTDSKGALSSYVIALSVKDPVALAGTTSITKTYGELTQQAYTVTGGTGAYSFLGSNANGTNFCAPITGTTSTYTYEQIVSVGACNWLSPTGSGNISADYVVAAGGGGGGSSRGGGGGGGGVAYGTGLTLAPSTIYPIGVGAGGAGATTEGYGYNGGNSWISTSDGSAYQVAAGGGGGGAAWTGSGSNGGTGVTAPTATVKSAAGNGGGASPNSYSGTFLDFLGGSGGTGGNFTAYSGGNSYKCTDTSQKEDGRASSSSGRVTGGGGGAGGNGGGQTVNGGTATCWVYSATGSAIPNGGAAYSTSLTGNTLYFGGGGGGSDGRSSTLSEYVYGSTGRGLGANGGGNGEQPDVYTGGVATNAKIISALPGSAATDNSGGGGGAGLGNGYAGGSGAIVLRYPMPTTRVLNAMSLNTVSNTNGSGAVLLTIPEKVTAGSKVETISVSSGGGAATLYTVNITINKATPTVSLTLPGNVATAKYGNAVTIYASATTDGTLAFSDSGTAIAGCASAATTSGVATCTWTPTVIGTRNITATFTPTDATDYNNATSSAFSVVVGKADTLTVDAGDETFTYTGSAPTVLKPFTYLGLVSIDTLTAVGMIYTGTANDGTVINQKTAPILAGTYTSTPDTTVAGVSTILNNYVAISLLTGTLTINRATPALSLIYANSNAVTYSPTATLDTVTASRSGAGAKSFSSITPVNCSVDSVTARMTVLQAGYCQVVMSVVQDPNYLAATVTDSITISKATRTIALTATFSTLKYYDTTTVTTTLSGGATDGAITYSLNATPGCSFDSLGAILTATSGTLACTLNATIAEGTNYLTASTTSPLNLTIAKANAPVITISTVSSVDYVAGTRAQIAPQYTVTGFKGTDNWSSLTLTYAFVSNPFETFSYSDTNTPIDAGTYSITPSALTLSSGLLSNYQTPAYASSSINFTINRIIQAPIYIDNVNGEVITPFTLSIRGGSNATGTSSFAVVSGAGCSISGNVLTATTAGQCLIRGTLSAGRNYLAVTSDTTTVRVRSYTLIPVFTFVGNPNTAISLAGATPLTKGSSTCTSGCVPTLTLATPSSGYPGDVIILTGTQFTGVTGVLFNVFTPAITFNADSDTQITVQVPAGLVTNSNDSIEVVTPGGISSRNFDIFTVLP